MENYTSDSSDSDNNSNKTIDYAYLLQTPETIDASLLSLIDNDEEKVIETENMIIHHNQLRKLPKNIKKFTNLKVLDISNNGLTLLPNLFKHCQLITLIAKNNCLTNESLPKSFTRNLSLKELNLSGNLLQQFPEQVFDFINLKYLYLGGNQIKTISKNIWKLKCLQILSMGGNQLFEVPASLGQLKQLHALILCDNQIESLPPNIANLNNLKSLSLHKNKLRTLPPEIVTLKNLTELSLRENPLVVRFVTDMSNNPASLLELSARSIKLYNLKVVLGDIPRSLIDYLETAHHCVNPRCKGVFFDNRVEHIKFVDFCGKYRIPLLHYLCSTKCVANDRKDDVMMRPARHYMMKKVLLG